MAFYEWGWKPRPTAAARRYTAKAESAKLAKSGRTLAPVAITGRTIARTFWGSAWCKNLESYSDFASRLPRGRAYVRSGSVFHLEIRGGSVEALVSGSSVYTVKITVSPVPKARWKSICGDSVGSIDSLVELLQGKFSKSVMERFCHQRTGLFPTPKEISFDCSCPDWASMCKHVSAVLYGVGARLDQQPELLFALRRVDANDLLARAGTGPGPAKRGPAKNKVLAGADLSALFGVQMADETRARPGAKTRRSPKAAVKKVKSRRKKATAAKRKSGRARR